MALLLRDACARRGLSTSRSPASSAKPDYEQRFTAPAKDLDKVLKAIGADVHVYTLTGADATRARLTQVLEQVAREAKPDDDFVLMLIGHGSYDGVEYKFNLVGPDISAAELADAVQSHRREAAADRQHHELQRRFHCRVSAHGPGVDRLDQERHREERHRVRRATGSRRCRIRRPTWIRTSR